MQAFLSGAFSLWDPGAWNGSCRPLPNMVSERFLPTRRYVSHVRLRERLRVNYFNVHTGDIKKYGSTSYLSIAQFLNWPPIGKV